MREEAVVRLKPLDGAWETCGADRLRGIRPEGIQYSYNQWGCDTATFGLRRDPGGMYPDLTAFTDVEIEVGGVKVWTGRTSETPITDNAAPIINVKCQGWQYHLDDDKYSRVYVHNKLSDYQDLRSFSGADLTKAHTGGVVASQYGVVTIGWANGAIVPNGGTVGVMLDLGPGQEAKRVYLNWESSNNHPGATLYCRGSDTDEPISGASDNAFSFTLGSGASGSNVASFTSTHRYVAIFAYQATGGTLTGDVYFKLKNAIVFRDAAYESGSASILKASEVVRDALSETTSLLSDEDTQIEDTSFAIPAYSTEGYKTARDVITAVNSYHDYIAGVDIERRPVFKAKPDTPILEVGEWSGGEFQDASANSGEEVFSRVIVEGTGPDGEPLAVERTTSDLGADETIVERRGFRRTRSISVSSAMTETAAETIGDIWLTQHRSTQMKGGVKAASISSVRKVLGGESIHPLHMGLYVNELLRLSNRVDPDTGGFSKSGRIVGVSCDVDSASADIQLDNSRTDFEALLARYAVISGS